MLGVAVGAVLAEPDAVAEAAAPDHHAAGRLGRAGQDELAEVVERALAEQADAVEKVKAGNPKGIGAIVGAVMKATKGQADAKRVRELVIERCS